MSFIFLSLVVLLVELGWGAAPAIASICNADQLCPTNPCTISGTHFIGCDLDFGDKDVTIARDGALQGWSAQELHRGQLPILHRRHLLNGLDGC
jgi:hypothetical protein